MAQNKPSSNNSKPNLTKKQKVKKLLTNKIFLFSSVIGLSVVGAGAMYIVQGGNIGYDHSQANKSYTESEQDAKNTFKQHHVDGLPTMETVQSYLKSKFNTDDLTTISIDKINSAIADKFGSKYADLISSGKILSETMTPDDADQAEVVLAKQAGFTKDYIGLPKIDFSTNLYQDGYTTQNKSLNLGPGYSYSSNAIWKNLDKAQISQPFISTTQSNSMVNAKTLVPKPKYYSLILFVQPTSEMSWQDLISYLKDTIAISVNGTKIDLAGNNSTTRDDSQGIYGKGNGLQLARLSNSDFSKSDNIFPNSVIPIVYDVPVSSITGESVNVNIPAINSFSLKFNKSNSLELN